MFRFRPQQGLTIMNYENKILCKQRSIKGSFRPQQGLTIMNEEQNMKVETYFKKFPSPTGVNYYESMKEIREMSLEEFPSPTGVNYYEFIENLITVGCLRVSVPNRG